MCTEDFRKLDFKIFEENIGIIPQVSKRRQYQEVLRSVTVGNSTEEKRGQEVYRNESDGTEHFKLGHRMNIQKDGGDDNSMVVTQNHIHSSSHGQIFEESKRAKMVGTRESVTGPRELS